MPASDLQSQLNDMLDDSASDNSSSVQLPQGANPLLHTASTPFMQPNPAFGGAQPQRMMALSGEDSLRGDVQMQADGAGQDSMQQQQQIAELQDQLQVRHSA